VIHALKRIENRSKLVLVLAGGVKTDWEKLQTIADQKNLGNRVRFLGRIPDSDLPALYSGAMALVYPSFSEGFGLQTVEAMAVGCPVLASSVTSLPEVLGQGGVLFSPENASELAGLIDRLEHEPSWRQELCQNALARGKQFDWKITAEKTLTAFLELLTQTHVAKS
jgi:alpha-1,3-rhamnosyl/mannosyltransferase